MARDVDATLHHIVKTHSKEDDAYAAAYIKALRETKRYVRDVY